MAVADAVVQCDLGAFREREGSRSAATQWSEQQDEWPPPRPTTPPKTIPGYTGHLPGRYNVIPGKTFSQEMDTLLTALHSKAAAVLPLSRHYFASAVQPLPPPEYKRPDPPRPPSVYATVFAIPGYQGFVPGIRTSTSSLGIRYMKAVEKSLQRLNEQRNSRVSDQQDEPEFLVLKRHSQSPRHRPHPKQESPSATDEQWRLLYRRPPSTYVEASRARIPGYRGFVPHLRDSPSTVGVRYSKAAQRCLEASARQAAPKTGGVNWEPTTDEPQIESDGIVNEVQSDTEKCSNNCCEDIWAKKPSRYESDERCPIPGYKGFVPRLKDSPTTLGLRYAKAAGMTLGDVHKVQRKSEEQDDS